MNSLPQSGEMTYSVTWQHRALCPSDILEYFRIENVTTACVPWRDLSHPWESHEKSTGDSVVHLGTWICVNIQAFFKKREEKKDNSHYSGESHGGNHVYEWHYAPHIVLSCLMVSWMLHIHFVKPLTMVDKECQKSPTLIFLSCLSFVLFLWL